LRHKEVIEMRFLMGDQSKKGFMKKPPIRAVLLALCSLWLAACGRLVGGEEPAQEEHHQITVTCPRTKDVTITQEYVCQIRSHQHINVCAFVNGYVEEIHIREGQRVKKGDLMFKILPTLYKAKRDAELAEANFVGIEFENTKKLFVEQVVSEQEVALNGAKLSKAQAKAKLAQTELGFTELRAPFDGIVDSLLRRQGSLIKEGEELTSLSDNSLMWVYFNVPEARYLEYKADPDWEKDAQKVQLRLADGSTFTQVGMVGAIEANFNNETGNIPFRADFPNPRGLLRHGQTGNVLIQRTLKNVVVIPQQATFEILDKEFVYVVDKDGVVHQREIEVQNDLDQIFVIKNGLDTSEKIVVDGVEQVHDGEKVKYEFRRPEQVAAIPKNRVE
jgi:membrane fusion protein, multidrug efflux system